MSHWQSNQPLRESEVWFKEIPVGGDLPWAVLFPNDYSLATSSSGWQFVFSFLRNLGVRAERFCVTPVPYRSIDTDTMLERFPIITATISYECDIKNFLSWLCDAHIPLLPGGRADKNFPIIGVGGAVTYINPLALSGFADFVILGDGVKELGFVVKAIRSYSIHGDRAILWCDLARCESIFVPPLDVAGGELTRKLKISRELDLNSSDYLAHTVYSTPKASLGKSILLELQRGCARSCAYCTLPSCFGRCRYKNFENTAKVVNDLCAKFPDYQVGLVTPEAGDYYELDKLLTLLKQNKLSVSFASLRIDRLSELVFETLALTGHKSITVAPETANEELRFSCGKKFTNKLIIEKLLVARYFGITKAKLYFMIGLPGERDEDAIAIPEFCHEIASETSLELVITVNPFVPKPWTTWHDVPFIGKREAKRRYNLITKALRQLKGYSISINFSSAREAEEEYYLSWSSIEDSHKLCDNLISGSTNIDSCDRQQTRDILQKYFS